MTPNLETEDTHKGNFDRVNTKLYQQSTDKKVECKTLECLDEVCIMFLCHFYFG